MDYEPLEIGEYWADLNEHLCELLELVPEDLLRWEPMEGAWGVREIAAHIVGARDHWLARSVDDGLGYTRRPNSTVAELQGSLRASWERMESLLRDGEALAKEYAPPPGDPEYLDPPVFSGHYIAFHRLSHDIHHRAQLLDRLTQLGIEPSSSRRRRPL